MAACLAAEWVSAEEAAHCSAPSLSHEVVGSASEPVEAEGEERNMGAVHLRDGGGDPYPVLHTTHLNLRARCNNRNNRRQPAAIVSKQSILVS